MELDNYLKNFREQIDTLDHEIIYLLSRRFTLVEQIWKIKKDLWEEALQQNRWNELMANLLEEARERNVPEELVKNIWNEIHKHSLNIEK